MFKYKKNKNDLQAHASFGFKEGDDLIVDLKRRKPEPSGRARPEKKEGWDWKVLLRLPVGGLKIFRSRKDKGVEFMKNFPEEKKESFVKRIAFRSFNIWTLTKWIFRGGGKLLVRAPLLFFGVFRVLAILKKSNPFKNFFSRIPRRKKKDEKDKPEKEKRSNKEKSKNRDEEEHELLKGIYNSNRFFLKSLLSFFLLLFLLILPFKVLDYYTSFDLAELKRGVLGSSERAFLNFKTAAQALTKMDTGEAGENFSQANANFLEAKKQVDDINDILLELSRFAPQEEVRMASISKQVLSAGQAASSLGKNLTSAFDILLKFQKGEADEENPLQIVEQFEDKVEESLANAKTINNNVSQIDPDILPGEYKDDFSNLREKSRALEDGLGELLLLTRKSKIFLGSEDYNKKYLVVFQNSNELRASGGFIGSFAEVSFRKGELEEVRVPGGGSYDVDGGMSDSIVPPKPLRLVASEWNFRDANWWPDWPTSAQNLIRFYEKSGGPTVDGCIAITPEVLGRVLEVTGPLDMEEKYGIIIDKDNYWSTIRAQIEKEKESDDPKEIIKDLTDKIVKELSSDLDKEKMVALISGMQESLEAKDAQFYFSDKELQEEVVNRGWGGRIKDTKRDYLMVVNSNIAGKKSDKKIKQSIDHKAEIKEDGSVVNTLRINRIHQGDDSDEKYYRARNVNWMRVYVPEGSELLQAKGFERPSEKFFKESEREQEYNSLVKQKEEQTQYHRPSGTEVYPEQNKTVFANWSILDPGEKEVIELKYRLPFKLKKEERPPENWLDNIKRSLLSTEQEYLSYSFLAQRQAGADIGEINSAVIWPKGLEPVWNYPEDLSVKEKNWFVSRELDSDKYWAVILRSDK